MLTILLISPYWKEPHRWMVSTYNMAELWQRLGHKVVVVCMGSETRVETVSASLTVHFRRDFFLRDPLNFGISLGFARYVDRIIRNVKPDIVIVNKVLFWSSFAILRLWLRGIKVQLLTDALVGITWFPRNAIPGLIMRAGAWTMGWLVLLCAERVIFFHPQPERILKRLRIAGKARVIPTGIDPLPYSIQSTRQDSRITITYVGRLESVKGVDDLLAAAVPLKRKYGNLRIQVVGWYRDGHPLVAEYGKDVVFTGLREDIPAILATTDIFVMPSHSEGLSNALMEAMASGCACIASDVGGNTFLLRHGVSGLLFPAGDRTTLSAQIENLLQDPSRRRDLGVAARKLIQAEFSWESIGKQYRHLFTEVMASQSRANQN